MDNETVAAASSAAEEDVFHGESPTVEEFSNYRNTGEVPERFKPAEPNEDADSESAKENSEGETPESVPESEPEEQEPSERKPTKAKLTAEERIAQLESTIEKIRKGAGLRKAETAAAPEPETQPTQPRNYQEWETKFVDESAPQWIEQWMQEHPDKSPESAYAAMNRYMREAERYFEKLEMTQAQAQEFQSVVEEARNRYEDFDEVVAPIAEIITSNTAIPQDVKAALNKSPYLTDFLFALGSDPKELLGFIRTAKKSPREAIRLIANAQTLIQSELSGKTKPPEPQKAPAKPTSAPKPPSPVGGSASRAFDVSDENLSAEDWMRKRNQDVAARGLA